MFRPTPQAGNPLANKNINDIRQQYIDAYTNNQEKLNSPIKTDYDSELQELSAEQMKKMLTQPEKNKQPDPEDLLGQLGHILSTPEGLAAISLIMPSDELKEATFRTAQSLKDQNDKQKLIETNKETGRNTLASQLYKQGENKEIQQAKLDMQDQLAGIKEQNARDIAGSRSNDAMQKLLMMNILNQNKTQQSGMSPEAEDFYIKRFLQTGEEPTFGMGQAAQSARMAFRNKAAQMAGELGISAEDVAYKKANYGANTKNLKDVDKQINFLKTFEETAKRNLDVAVKAGEKVKRTGIPLIDQPLLYAQEKIGNKEVSAYNAAINSAKQEIARVISSPTGVGQLTDTQRQEIEHLLNKSHTPDQIAEIAKIFKTDMENRLAPALERREEIKRSLGGKTNNKISNKYNQKDTRNQYNY